MATLSARATRKVGYARSTPDDPELERQREALQRFGCSIVFESRSRERDFEPLHSAIAGLGKGDVLVVWSIGALDLPVYIVSDLVGRHGASLVALAR
jgi:hypothetical protein